MVKVSATFHAMWNIQKKIYREERDTVVKGKGEKGTIHPTLVYMVT